MRILFTTKGFDWPLSNGGQIREWNVLQALKLCGDVDVLAFQATNRPIADRAYRGCANVVPVYTSAFCFTAKQRAAYASTIGRLLLVCLTARPFQFFGPDSPKLRKWFAAFVKEARYDAIWIADPAIAVALRWHDQRRTILDEDDLEYVREWHLCRATPWYGAKICNYIDIGKLLLWEMQFPRRFARVVRCSDSDRRRIPARNIVVIPNGTDIALGEGHRAPERRVVFVGTLGYGPNRIGIEWFLRCVWPLLRDLAPGAEIDIVGKDPSPWLAAQDTCEGIHVHGFVRDLALFWERAAVSVVPLLAGAGTRLKILDSLARGVPVVSTSIGAHGLDVTEADGVFRVDSPDDFARRCARVLDAPHEAHVLAQRGRETVASRYDWRAIQGRIVHLVREVADGRLRGGVGNG